MARTVLGATGVQLTDAAKRDLADLERAGFSGMPVCLAKTHLSISDDETVRGKPAPFTLTVTSLRGAAGAGYVVALCGAILTMPGLPKEPAASRIDIARTADGAWHVVGLR